MSLKHILKAEKLGRCHKDYDKLASLEGLDLSQVRSPAGCNMLYVYLINRWGQLFESGPMSITEENEAFHKLVVEAYLQTGCKVDEKLPARKLNEHMSTSFRMQVQLSGKLSAVDFLKVLHRELHPDMFPEPYVQLERLIEGLESGAIGGADDLPAAAQTEALAQLWRGLRLSPPLDRAALETESKALGLELVLAGDEAILGLCLASTSADDGAPVHLAPRELPDLSKEQRRHLAAKGSVGDFLLASGPLAGAILARGKPGQADDPGQDRFIAGCDMRQNPHTRGVWGQVVSQTGEGIRTCALHGEDLFLIARYD
ncbi:MAG: hypothetical protein JRF33_20660 [Deltaproteobacteria bacterium]|nr:hypothetical protein [Deltaproteobacteria bacterium]